MQKVVAYLRVSTARQGQSGLGLEAQRQRVQQWAVLNNCTIGREFVEVESGKVNDRPQLAEALADARIKGQTLVIATLDRLSRDAAFLMNIRSAGVTIACADGTTTDVLNWGMRALISQDEREKISARTRAALQARKARNPDLKLGNPNGAAAFRRAGKGNADAIVAVKADADAFAARLKPTIRRLQAEGNTTLRRLAEALNNEGVKTPRGGDWHATSVKNLLARLERVTVRGHREMTFEGCAA